MLVVLKIPVVYLCAVVWWAIRAEPRPLEGVGVVASLGPRRRPSATGGRVALACSAAARSARRGGRRRGRPARVAHARARVTA